MKRSDLNSRGSILIEVLIGAGMMFGISLGVTTMLANQNKEVKALSEKLQLKEVEMQMKNLFADPNYCNCLLRGKTFDTTAGSEAIVVADQLTQLPTGYSTGPADAPPCTVIATDFIPTAGSTLTGSTVTIGSIGLKNMQLISPSTYKADISVSFTNTVRALKDITTKIQFSIDPTLNTPTTRPFLACGSATPVRASLATKLGLDPNIWPDNIVCLHPADYHYVMTLSMQNPLSANREVYYTSSYTNATSLPYNTGMMMFNGVTGAWINNFSGATTCPNQSIQTLKSTGQAW